MGKCKVNAKNISYSLPKQLLQIKIQGQIQGHGTIVLKNLLQLTVLSKLL